MEALHLTAVPFALLCPPWTASNKCIIFYCFEKAIDSHGPHQRRFLNFCFSGLLLLLYFCDCCCLSLSRSLSLGRQMKDEAETKKSPFNARWIVNIVLFWKKKLKLK